MLDVMAGMLENTSASTGLMRKTIATVYRSAQIIASLPNLSYNNKVSKIGKTSSLLVSTICPMTSLCIIFGLLCRHFLKHYFTNYSW